MVRPEHDGKLLQLNAANGGHKPAYKMQSGLEHQKKKGEMREHLSTFPCAHYERK